MVVGVATVRLLIPNSHSLKDKRQVVRSVVERMRQRFNVAVAEVGDLENWQVATLGIVSVSNDAAYVHGLLSKSVNWLSDERLDAEIGDVSIELW